MDTTFRMLYPFHIGVVPADSCYNFSKIARVTIIPMSVPVSVSVLPTLSSSIWSINFVYIKSCSGSYSFLLNVLNLYHFWLNIHLQIFTDLKAQILASQVSFVSSLNAVATTNVLCRKFLSVELPMNYQKSFIKQIVQLIIKIKHIKIIIKITRKVVAQTLGHRSMKNEINYRKVHKFMAFI